MVHISGQAILTADTEIDGVLPVKQPRGRRARDRLLNAGQRLVARRPIDSISVADIARAADSSVGAFYLRFRDKDAFFRALIVHYLAEGQSANAELFASHDGDHLITALVESTAERFRRFAGLIRSAIRKRMEDPTIWEPIRLSGHVHADSFIDWLAVRRKRALTAEDEITVRFAFQVLYGTLNNALVNDPGPLGIEDSNFLVQLERAFRLTLFSTGPWPLLPESPA